MDDVEEERPPGDDRATQLSEDAAPRPASGPVEAMKARAPRLEPGIACGAALAQSASAASRQILWNWDALVSGGDEECVHQMRVAARRLRVAMRVFQAVRASEAWAHVNDDAKALIAVTCETRDLDVLACDVVAPLGRVPERPDLAGLRRLLDEARRRARDELVSALGELRWVAFRSKLAVWPIQIEQRIGVTDEEAFERPARKIGDKELRRVWKRIDEAASVVDTLDVDQRHALRKDLRRLRYAVDLLGPLHEGRDGGRMVTEIRRLQISLGHLNDLAMARKLIDIAVIRDCTDAAVQRAAGFAIGWHAAKSEDSWRETIGALARLRKGPLFWE